MSANAAPAKRRDPIVPLQYKLVTGAIAGVIGTSVILCVDRLPRRAHRSPR
jgi:hypothetical protein